MIQAGLFAGIAPHVTRKLTEAKKKRLRAFFQEEKVP
jgi:hypothetical protein